MARRKKIKTYANSGSARSSQTRAKTHKKAPGAEHDRFTRSDAPAELYEQYRHLPLDGAIAQLFAHQNTSSSKENSSASEASLQRTPDEKLAGKEHKTHKVKKNETLWGLSKKYYGDATKFDYIYYANREKITSPEKLPENIEIAIPYFNQIGTQEASKNSQNPEHDENQYIDQFKFMIKAKSYSVIQNQKKFVAGLSQKYASKESFSLLKELAEVKKFDEKLAQKESDAQILLHSLQTPMGNNAFTSMGNLYNQDLIKSSWHKLRVIQSLRAQLVAAYPALRALEGKDSKGSLEQMQAHVLGGLGEMQTDLDEAWNSISEEDISLNQLSPVVQAILQSEKITREAAAEGDKKSAAILSWLRYQRYKERAISIGGFVLSLGLLIASGLSGGALAPIALSVASAIVATGTSIYDLEMAHDIYTVAKAGEGKLTGQYSAKFNYVMGMATLALDAIGVGKTMKLMKPGVLLGRSAKLSKIVKGSKAMGKPLFGNADGAGVLGKILNLSEKEFDLAMDILENKNLQWIQEHHWINEKLADYPIWKHYGINIHGDWNKNYLVGHAGKHHGQYLVKNRELLETLYKNKNYLSKEKVESVLQDQVNFLRQKTKEDPSFLHQNANKPVVVLE